MKTIFINTITRSILLIFIINNQLNSQTSLFKVEIMPFSSSAFLEFAPSYYNGGIVFCSDRKNASLLSYQNAGKSLLSMFYYPNCDSNQSTKISFFDNKLTTQFNDGSASFNEDENLMCFSRNININMSFKNNPDKLNPMGLFFAKKHEKKWIITEAFLHNSSDFSNKTPSLSKNGEKLFFSSNRPGGYGNFDLYYSDYIDNEWQTPINLGPLVNTPNDESFPYISETGKLYFSTDGHKGFGGKDVFYTEEYNNKWTTPVNLENDINSEFDDFGIVTDNDLHSGFISSNRSGNDDIYRFNRNYIQFENCNKQKENKFCYKFFDERNFDFDSIQTVYNWNFGKDINLEGQEVKYCFPGPGEYSVSLIILDPASGDTLNNIEPYPVQFQNKIQGYIKSKSQVNRDDLVEFDGTESNLPNLKITDYYWDFGEGFTQTGSKIKYKFPDLGEYKVKLGIKGIDTNGEPQKQCVFKIITVIEHEQ